MAVTEVARSFAEALDNKFEEDAVTVEEGRSFDRIVILHEASENNRAAHCFVERATGQVFKTATWASPAKGARFDLTSAESFETVVTMADPHGSYLYKKRRP